MAQDKLSGLGGAKFETTNVWKIEDAELKAENEKLKKQVQELTQNYREAADEAERLAEVNESLANKTGVKKLNEELTTFRETAARAAATFRAFIRGAGLGSISDLDWAGLSRQITEGAISGAEALAEVKSKYAEVLNIGKSNGVPSGSLAGLDIESLSTIVGKIDALTESIKNMRASASEAGGGGGLTAESLKSVMLEITSGAEAMDEATKEAYRTITELVSVVAQMGNLPSNSLFDISKTFQGLAEISHGGIGAKTVENVVALTDALNRMGGTGTIRVDFSGFKDLKISKASMRNLADYLPTIAGANVDNLIKLSNVDLTNFNNLKVNKGAAEELAKIAEAVRVFNEAKAGSVDVGQSGVTISGRAKNANTQAAEEEKAWAQRAAEQEKQINAEIEAAYKEYARQKVEAEKEAAEEIRAVRQQEAEDAKQSAQQKAEEEKAWAQRAAEQEKQLNAEVEASYKERDRQKVEAEKEAAAASKVIRQREAEEEKQLQSIRKDSASSVERIRDALVKYASVSGKASNKEAYANLVKYNEAYSKLDALYANGKISVEGYRRGVDNLDKKVKENTNTLNQNANSHSALGAKLRSVIVQYLSFTRIVSYAVRSVREMVQASMELDKALTQMQIVTGASNAEMERFSDTAFEAASRAASNVTDIISGATTYARLGFDPQTSTALAEYTAMLQNVGDINAQDAQDAITAIIKAFDGVDETNIKEKLDELVVVGNNFPISVSQVAEGMNNASSALAAAGNTYEKSVALLTAANTTMQNASKASTGLRTITARLRNTKTELDDLGEAMTESQYDEVVQALTNMNVKLIDVNGNYRDTYDIFKDIAAQWDKMSSTDQAALATKLSGTRMQAVFYSLVQNFGEAEKAMEAMGAAEGELTEKNEVFANSIEGRMNQFRNEFKRLATEIFTSDWIKDAVSMAKELLGVIANIAKAITGVVKALGGIKGTLFAITALVANIKIASIARSAATLLETGKKLTVMQSLALSLTGKQTAANAGMALSFKQIATSAKEAAVAWLTSPIGAATAVAGATALFIRQIQKSSEKQSQEMADAVKAYEEVKSQISESEDKIADLNGELKTTRDRLAELSRIKSPTYVEQDELAKAQAMTAELEKQIEDEEKLLKYRRTAEMPAFNDMVWNNLVSVDRSFGGGTTKSQKFLASLGLFKDNYGDWSHIIPQSYVTEGADFRPFLTSDSSAVDVLLKLPTLVEMAQAIIEANKGDSNARYSIKTGLSETDDITLKSSNEMRPLQYLIDFVEDSRAAYAKTITELTKMVDGAELILNPSNKEEEDYNWNIRKINSIIHLFEHELGDDPRRMGAFEDTAAMWGFSSYEEFLQALRSGDERARWFIDDLNDMGIATGEVKGRFHVLGQELRDTESDTKDLSTAVKSLRQALSEVSQVKTGLDQLDKIYADILNGGKFDYTTLIDENFTELFGNLDSFDDFIHTVANAPDDIDACQAAFNRLTSEFIVQSGCLQDLDEDTRAMMLRFLAEQGVIDDTGEAADRLTQIYRVLDAQKKLLEEHKLDTSSDVDALITLATQADATSASIIRLTNAKAMLAKAEAIGIQIDSNPNMNVKEAQRLEQLAQRLTEQAAAILSKPIEFDLLEVNYSGGDTTRGVRDSIAKDVEQAAEQSSEKIKTWFEEQYAEHKHLVAMEKETDYEYYTWLEGAMKKAYAEGILSQEDYWKYEEEVYNGMKKLRENAEKEAQSNLDKLVDIRKKMLEKEVSDQKDALNDQLKNLKDFYDKQKKMLQDSYDEEDYLEEQAEKRKSVSDLEEELARLRYDDSAWAQKRRAEISQQIADARKDLNDFERDHARDEALSFLDEQESAAEEKINAQIETLDEKYKSAKELYEQALADVKNGSVELYREMIKWNGEYGDGIDDTITSAWEGAYQALSDYNTLFGKTFKGINLANVTGYVLKPVGTGYASGTSYAVPGLHPIDEKGSETYFSPSTGGKYKMFSGGEKVLTAKASDFLYRFANGGSEMLKKFIASVGGGVLNDRLTPLMTNNEIVMGDIVVNGNADRATVSEIRRAQRESVEFMLKEFGKLNR